MNNLRDVAGNILVVGDIVAYTGSVSQLRIGIVQGFTSKKVFIRNDVSPNFTEHKFPSQIALLNINVGSRR